MRRSVLLLSMLAVLPLSQAQAQYGQAEESDSTNAAQAMQTGLGMGFSFLSMFGRRASNDRNATAWCPGACAAASRGSAFTSTTSAKWVVGGDLDGVDEFDHARRDYVIGTLEQLFERSGGDASIVARSSEKGAAESVNGNGNGNGYAKGKGKKSGADDSSEPAFTNFFEAAMNSTCVLGLCVPPEAPPEYRDMGPGLQTDNGFYTSSPGAQFGAMALVGDPGIIVNPEPGSILLTVSGLAGVALMRRRLRRHR